MEGEFPFVVTAGWLRRMLTPIFAAGFAAAGVFVFGLDAPLWVRIAVPGFLTFIALGLANMAVHAIFDRATFYADRIETLRWFKRREIKRDQIIGLRSGHKGADVALLTREDEDDPFELTDDEVEDEDVLEWLTDIPNLDARDSDAKERKFLSDPRFGDTPRQRRATLKRLIATSRTLEALGFIFLMWVGLVPIPYLWAVGAAALLPFLVLLIHVLSGRLLSLGPEEPGPDFRPGIGTLMTFAAIALAVRAALDFQFPQWPLLIAACVPAAALVVFLLRAVDKVVAAMPVWAFVLALFYVAGIAAQADVLLDNPTEFQVATIVSTGPKDIYITLYAAPADGKGQVREFRVSPLTHALAHRGQKLCSYGGPGRLGLRWSYSVTCSPPAR